MHSILWYHLIIPRGWTMVHVDKPRKGNLPLWFMWFFQVGIRMFNKACLSWTWKKCSKPWQKSWSLQLTRLTLSLSIPPTCMWWVIHVSQWLSHVFPKYLKVIEIDAVHVLGFIEGKQCFSSIVFLKNKTHNHLNNQLHLVVFMYTQIFSHLAPFHTRLHIRCGLMFNQQMAKENMLEFC